VNKTQYALLKKALIRLKETHTKARKQNYDFKSLNYYCDIIEGFQNFKDFNAIQENIIKEIGGL